MIYESVGSYASLPILSLMLHLSIGDVWNTINNVERRFGVAVTGVFCVWLSKAHAAYQYSLVNSLAGKLLGATLIWLTIATALVTATWRLNPDPETGKLEPLYPVTGKALTKFAWFSSKA
jgi:translocator protein